MASLVTPLILSVVLLIVFSSVERLCVFNAVPPSALQKFGVDRIAWWCRPIVTILGRLLASLPYLRHAERDFGGTRVVSHR
jgi:hypothetical protein